MLPFLRRKSPAAEPSSRQRKPPKDGLLPVENADTLLQRPHRQELLRQIKGLLALPRDCAEYYVIAALRRYAAFVQEVPASEVHHHSGRGGMLDHGLEVVLKALQIRRGYVLPPGAEPERLTHEADAWSYGVFAGSLLHDVGKPVVDQLVHLYDEDGRRLGAWEPWYGPMSERPGVHWYSVKYRRGRVHKLHEPVSSLVAHWILPPKGMAWISQHPELLQAWIHAIHGDMDHAGPLGQIIMQADRESVSRNLGGESPDRLPTPTKPLHEKLLTSLRHLLSEEELPLNRNGAAGWRTEEDLWLVSKRAADALRAQLRDEGHSGIPSGNDRIFDTLQEHGLLTPHGDRAIWKAKVAGSGWSNELTLIRLPVSRVWSDPDAMPPVFEGTVEPVDAPAEDTVTAGGEDPAGTAAPEPTKEAEGRSEPVESTGGGGSSDAPAPAAAPDSDDLPVPPGMEAAVTDDESAEPDTSAAEPAAPAAPAPAPSPAPEAAEDLPDDAGEAFLAWVRRGVADGELSVNTRDARVHVTEEGVLLVSPGIFRDFGRDTGCEWQAAQKRFQKRKLHRRAPDDTNIHSYVVEGGRQSGRINGLLIPDVRVVFGEDWTPSANPHIRRGDG
ncbi:MobH family relaxase [Thioalkalivibrio sp. ALE20]|uniref:MobH family relaxase n=1 Tax=Thioalkalivibrio sp. ALE20 TaxID=545275 RepID=UPI0003A7AE66|nr:MobH family relaxase [Thioalkalivibrio sp. ALE20]